MKGRNNLQDVNRLIVDFDENGERVTLPFQPSFWEIPFLAGMSGISIWQLYEDQFRSDHPYFIIKNVTLAVGIALPVLAIFFTLLGAEILRLYNGELIHVWKIGLFRREARYKISEIRSLCRVQGNFSNPDKDSRTVVSPFREFGERGQVKFDIGHRSVYLGAAVTDETADALHAWLARRLPSSALTS